MFEQIEDKLRRFEELQKLVGDPKIISNPREYKKCAKELSLLQKVVSKYKEYKKTQDEISHLEKVIGEKRDGEEFLKLAEEELPVLKKKVASLEKELNELLTEKEEDLARNIIMEIPGDRRGRGCSFCAGFISNVLKIRR